MTLHTRLENICGSTPLIKISDRVYGKLETYSPTGSVKDRFVSYAVRKALIRGDISEGTILCEATSGNTGISLSAIAASLGLQCIIFMPENMSEERREMMRTYGAKIVDAPFSDFQRAIEMRNEFIDQNENSWSPMQFSNPENVECHMTITGPEIAKQAGPSWAAFVHGSGTGGTIEGIRKFVKSERLPVKVLMVTPAEELHGIQGIGDGQDFLASPSTLDGTISIATQDAIDRAKLFAKETGILVGISAGANILASERWVQENDPFGIVVTMLCDRGERYMTIYNRKA
tara:strand:- start:819 stop:1685 length:867 start_codon:yes stop_codon:yes gene_type:complete